MKATVATVRATLAALGYKDDVKVVSNKRRILMVSPPVAGGHPTASEFDMIEKLANELHDAGFSVTHGCASLIVETGTNSNRKYRPVVLRTEKWE